MSVVRKSNKLPIAEQAKSGFAVHGRTSIPAEGI